MLNPVLALDLRLASRRSRPFTLRFLYALWLLMQVVAVGCLWLGWPFPLPSGLDPAEIVELFLQFYILQHFALLAVAVPAYLCGAITEEKESGRLILLLTAEITPWSIVSGKFLARMLQVSAVVLVPLPLFCLVGGWFGYLSWLTVLSLLGLSVAFVLALGGFCLWQSVRASETRHAALRVYCVLGFVLTLLLLYVHIGVPFFSKQFRAFPEVRQALAESRRLILLFDPLYVLAPSWNLVQVDELWRRMLPVCLICLGVGLTFLILSVLMLRKAALQSLEAPPNRKGQGPKREPVAEEQPVCWRERLRRRYWPHWIAAGVLVVLTTEAHRYLLPSGQFWHLALVWSGAGLLLSFPIIIRASGVITGERNRMTWESLLISPLETWQILLEKRRGVLLSYSPYYVGFLIPALILAWLFGIRAVIFVLALGLVWGMLLYFLASTGIWCSAFSPSSWRSLVATVGRGYGFFLGIVTIIALIHFTLGCVLAPVAGILSNFMGVTTVPENFILGVVVLSALYLAWRLHKSADHRLWLAQTWIETRERYGRTFTRSLTRALRNAQERRERKAKEAALAAQVSRLRDDPPRYSS